MCHGIERVVEQVDHDLHEGLGHNRHLTGSRVEVHLKRERSIGLALEEAALRGLGSKDEQAVEVGRGALTARCPRVEEHPVHDPIRAMAVLFDFRRIGLEIMEQFAEFGEGLFRRALG